MLLLPSKYLRIFLKVFSLLIIVVDVIFALYIPYLYYKSKFRNKYVESIIYVLVLLYIVNLLSELFTLLVIVYLIYQDYGFSDAISDISYASFYKVLNTSPVLFVLIGFSFIIYVFSFLAIIVINNHLIRLAHQYNLKEIEDDLTVLNAFQKATFIIFVVFFIATLYVDIVERAIIKYNKYRNEHKQSN